VRATTHDTISAQCASMFLNTCRFQNLLRLYYYTLIDGVELVLEEKPRCCKVAYRNSAGNWVVLRGKVVSGLSEGAKYVELYRERFREYLGIDPYPGTLNVVLIGSAPQLPLDKAIVIPPPRPGFGEVYAYRAHLGGLEVYVVRPVKTRHPPSTIEVVSSYCLREKLGLRDGSLVEIYVMV